MNLLIIFTISCSTFFQLQAAPIRLFNTAVKARASIRNQGFSSVFGDPNLIRISSTYFKVASFTRALSYDSATSYFLRRLGDNNGLGGLAKIRNAEEDAAVTDMLSRNQYNSAMIGLRKGRTMWRWIVDGSPIRGQGFFKISGALERDRAPLKLSCIKDCVSYCGYNKKQYAAFHQESLKCFCSDFLDFDASCNSYSCLTIENYGYYYSSNETYDHWVEKRPALSQGCVAVSRKDGNFWMDLECEERHPFLCEFDRPVAAKMHLDLKACFLDKCYALFKERPSTWDEAEEYCETNGGYLAKVDSFLRQLDVEIALANFTQAPARSSQIFQSDDGIYDRHGRVTNFKQVWPKGNGPRQGQRPAATPVDMMNNYIWIGARNTGYIWPDGSTPESECYDNWGPNQPDVRNDCVVTASSRAGEYQWRTARCENQNVFAASFTGVTVVSRIAEIEQTQTSAPSVAVVTPARPTTPQSVEVIVLRQQEVPPPPRIPDGLPTTTLEQNLRAVAPKFFNRETDSTTYWIILGLICGFQLIVIIVLIVILICRCRNGSTKIEPSKPTTIVDVSVPKRVPVALLPQGSQRPPQDPPTAASTQVTVVQDPKCEKLLKATEELMVEMKKEHSVQQTTLMKSIEKIDELKAHIIHIPPAAPPPSPMPPQHMKINVSVNGKPHSVISTPIGTPRAQRAGTPIPPRSSEQQTYATCQDDNGGGHTPPFEESRPETPINSFVINIAQDPAPQLQTPVPYPYPIPQAPLPVITAAPVIATPAPMDVVNNKITESVEMKLRELNEVHLKLLEYINTQNSQKIDIEKLRKKKQPLRPESPSSDSSSRVVKKSRKKKHHTPPDSSRTSGSNTSATETISEKHHKNKRPDSAGSSGSETITSQFSSDRSSHCSCPKTTVVSPRTMLAYCNRNNGKRHDKKPIVVVKQFCPASKRDKKCSKRNYVMQFSPGRTESAPSTPRKLTQHGHFRHSHDAVMIGGKPRHVDAKYCQDLFGNDCRTPPVMWYPSGFIRDARKLVARLKNPRPTSVFHDGCTSFEDFLPRRPRRPTSAWGSDRPTFVRLSSRPSSAHR